MIIFTQLSRSLSLCLFTVLSCISLNAYSDTVTKTLISVDGTRISALNGVGGTGIRTLNGIGGTGFSSYFADSNSAEQVTAQIDILGQRVEVASNAYGNLLTNNYPSGSNGKMNYDVKRNKSSDNIPDGVALQPIAINTGDVDINVTAARSTLEAHDVLITNDSDTVNSTELNITLEGGDLTIDTGNIAMDGQEVVMGFDPSNKKDDELQLRARKIAALIPALFNHLSEEDLLEE